MSEKSAIYGGIKNFFSDKKRRVVVLLCVLAAALLLIAESGVFKSEKTVSSPQDAASARELDALRISLEQRLCALISQIDGAGKVSVMITLEQSEQTLYEKNTKTEAGAGVSAQSETVLAGSSKQPLKVGTVLPTVRGAAVVCSGARDAVIREKVSNLCAKALNIGLSRVYVTS